MQASTTYIQCLAWGTDAGFYRLVPQQVLHPADEAQVQQIIARAHREGKHSKGLVQGCLVDFLLVV